jgi:sugar diacid utilization regulator
MSSPITIERGPLPDACPGGKGSRSSRVVAPRLSSADAPDPGVGELLGIVVRAARDELGVARCAVYALRPGALLECVASAAAPGVEPDLRHLRALDDAPLARDAVRSAAAAIASELPGELALVRPGQIRPAVAVPLSVDGALHGVLEVEQPPGVAGDTQAVTAYAALAQAVLTKAAARARDAHRAHAEHGRALLRGLAGAVLDGSGIEQVVARLADLLGLPVALLGPDLRVREWAAPAGMRLDPPPSLPVAALRVPAVRDALDGLGPERPSVVLAPCPAHGLARRHLVAVLRSGGAPTGYLDIIEVSRSLGPADIPVAEQAAAVLSVQLRAEAHAAQARDDVLADLLRGFRAESDLRRLARTAGLDLRRPHLLVRLPVAPDRVAADVRNAATAAAATALGEPQPPTLAEADAIVMLVRLPADPGPLVLRTIHRRLRDGMDAVAAVTGVRRAVVSGVCREIIDFPAALAETGEVDSIVARLGGDADVVPVTELSTLRLVVNGDRTDVAVRFAEQCLGPLHRSDTATGGDLVATLRGYLTSGAQVRATAKALGVHENTVRYRLGRIEHITGLDMRRFDALLAAQLALQIEGLTGPERTR